MKTISATTRIAVSLAALSVSLVLAAELLGMLPSERRVLARGRSALCESLAVNFSLLADRCDEDTMQKALAVIKRRNPDMNSIGVRRADGQLLLEVGDHAAHWQAPPHDRSTETHVLVPILSHQRRWGTVEVSFQPPRAAGLAGIVQLPVVRMALFMMAGGTVIYFFFLKRVLRHLNPSKVVPSRVRATLDTLAEGLLVLDGQGRIVLANRAFGHTIRRSPDELLGREASELPWQQSGEAGGDDAPPGDRAHPWSHVLTDGQPRTGELLGLSVDSTDRTFVVNATPIVDAQGAHRGVLTSFEDVTEMEEKRVQLSHMLDQLSQSSEEIRQQNEELERLATRDPLTSCYNRRAYFDQFETHWSNARRYHYPLSCVMVDIDHFKSINDTFGHQVGDRVLKEIARVLLEVAREGDVVSRYGGEEFAILLPHIGTDDAAHAAERFRAAIEQMRLPETTVTASLGVATLTEQTHDPQALMEEADKCLYAAKRMGRNQVVRWDRVPEDVAGEAAESSRPHEGADDAAPESIPFQVVTGLFSALAYRDMETAEHSRRVADLCVAVGEGLTSLRDCYLIEVAALLHDIGKVGVPDAILLKPGPLTENEWNVMRRHDRMSVEIVEASFGSPKLTAVVASHGAFFEGTPHNTALPRGTDIPLGARILSIADAYESMVSDRVYRKGRNRQEAFDELRRCAGTQFDPELVERFIQTVARRGDLHQSQVPGVSRKAATSIGRQISRLVAALDSRDTAGLEHLAGRLKASCERYGVSEVASKASTLETALAGNEDIIDILKAANELVDLCRAVQRASLRGIDGEAPDDVVHASVER